MHKCHSSKLRLGLLQEIELTLEKVQMRAKIMDQLGDQSKSIENPHNGRNENSQDAVQINKKSQKCRKSPITVVTHVLQNY